MRQRPVDRRQPELSPDDPFYEFFRRFGDPRTQQPPTRGEGSGFIISADGYILTNAHVVEDAREVTVRMTDRREYRAKVVGIDARTDVAVLRSTPRSFPSCASEIRRPQGRRMGRRHRIPFGFENSVTAGIVSAIARSWATPIRPFQTDVAVILKFRRPALQPAGRSDRINSRFTAAPAGTGVSFAIPIDVAMNVKNQLVATGRVQRGRIGVVIQEVNQALADSFKLSRPRGALVSQVENDGPADDAGLKPGDVILAVDGRDIERSSELPPVVPLSPKESTLTFWRDKSERSCAHGWRIGTNPGSRCAQSRRPARKARSRVRPLSGEERERLETAGISLWKTSMGRSHCRR